MAPTLSFLSTTTQHHHPQPPPPSHHTSPSLNHQMPNVFVVPPEEDQSPTWCCFDAADIQIPKYNRNLSTVPDLDSLDSALNTLHKTHAEDTTPIFRRDPNVEGQDSVVMPRRIGRQSAAEVMVGNDQEGETQGIASGKNVGEDSEIVEVIKVGRNREMDSTADLEAPPMKRSKTFRTRASKAFRSIKNVGKGSTSSRNKPSAKDMFASSGSTETSASSVQQLQRNEDVEDEQRTPRPPSRVHSPTLSRRGSVILSQFFHAPKNHSTFDAPSTYPSPTITSTTTTSTVPSPPSAHHTPHADTSPALDYLDPDPDLDRGSLRPSSPSPSTRTFSRRRFSILNLHRMFSFSTPSTTSHMEDPPITPRLSRDPSTNSSIPSTTSSASSSGLDTPTEDMNLIPFSTTTLGDDTNAGDKHEAEHWELPAVDAETEEPTVNAGHPQDTSFEMRLDSLHFDSLSFDADNF